MAESTLPVRTCVGCRERVPVTDLLRVVARGSRLVPDPRRRFPGRGASVHPTPECLRAAERRRAFPRALRVSAPLDTDLLQDHVDPTRTGSAQHQPSDRHPAGPLVESRTSSDDPPVKSHR
jgi:predicted RNA-binding protein YlxR (DUF448 family)